jgi:hypothetical protein
MLGPNDVYMSFGPVALLPLLFVPILSHVIPPVVHPTSSCSWGWGGWCVVPHPLSLSALGVGRFTSVPVVFRIGVSAWAILCWLPLLVVVQTVKIQVYTFS